jgi:hypothetical protein
MQALWGRTVCDKQHIDLNYFDFKDRGLKDDDLAHISIDHANLYLDEMPVPVREIGDKLFEPLGLNHWEVSKILKPAENPLP